MLAVLMVVSLTACGRESVGTPGGELENGVAAIEDAMTTKPNESSSASTTPIDDLRNGSSTDTVATPDDFPDAYNFGSGKISDYSRTAMLQKTLQTFKCSISGRKAMSPPGRNLRRT